MGNELKAYCVHCGGPMEFPSNLQGEKIVCPHCNVLTTLGEPKPPQIAQITNSPPMPKEFTTAKHVGKTFGSGCLIQLVGLVLLFFFPIGTVFGIALLICGHLASYHWECGTCSTRINSRRASICPGCGRSFV